MDMNATTILFVTISRISISSLVGARNGDNIGLYVLSSVVEPNDIPRIVLGSLSGGETKVKGTVERGVVCLMMGEGVFLSVRRSVDSWV